MATAALAGAVAVPAANANPLDFISNITNTVGTAVTSLWASDVSAQAATKVTGDVTVDDPTITGWENHSVNTTEFVGRIWTDKSVYKDSVTLKDPVDGGQSETVEKGDSQFLVALSALSSTSNITQTVDVPLDIVLVLDRSGSMDYGYSKIYASSLDKNKRYSRGVGDKSDVYWDEDSQAWCYTEYVWIFVPVKRQLTPKESEDSSGTQLYLSRLDALKEAANSFIDETAKTNKGIKDSANKHHVSIVQFSDSEAISTKILNNLQACDEADGSAEQLKTAVNGLSASGGTYTNAAFDRVNDVLNGSSVRSNAKKVVVFFTDGEPGSGDRVEANVADPTVRTAKSLKVKGTLIYSVGIFDGADANGTSDSNNFMNAVSSNYPNATSYTKLGDRVSDDAAYYKTAQTADELSKVFKEIQQSIVNDAGLPTKVTQGAENTSGYITFTDKLGDYMTVDGFKSIVLAGDQYTFEKVGSKAEDGGTKTTTYTFTGKVQDSSSIYGGEKANLSDIKITVKHSEDLCEGDTVTVQIPASMIPLRHFEIDQDKADNNMTVKNALPLVAFYGVSVKDGVAAKLAQPDDDMREYIASHTDKASGKVLFYSNNFTGGSKNAKGQTLGDTIAEFEPSGSNNYYFTANEVQLYTNEECSDAAKASNVNPGQPQRYWFKTTYYQIAGDNTHKTSLKGTAEPVEKKIDVTVDLSLDPNSWRSDDNGNIWVKTGQQRASIVNDFNIAKDHQVAKTADMAIDPQWADNAAKVQVHLGNNGSLAVELPASLSVTKKVEPAAGFTLPSNVDQQEFTFSVQFEGEGITDASEFTAQVVDASGKTVEGFDKTIKNKSEFKLKKDQTLNIYGIPAGVKYTVEEKLAPTGYTEKAAETTGKTGTLESGKNATCTVTNEFGGGNARTTVEKSAFAYKKNYVDADDNNASGWNKTPNATFEFRLDGVAAESMYADGATVDAKDMPLPTPDGTNGLEAYEDATGSRGVKVAVTKDTTTGNFDEIEFTKPGTYVYVISEYTPTAGSDEPGVKYSMELYRVTVVVEADEYGKLSVKSHTMVKVNDNGQTEDVSVAQITNVFQLKEAKVGPIGNKVYTDNSGGNPLKSGMFTFVVEPYNDAAKGQDAPQIPSGNWVVENNNSITFPQLTFTHDHIGNKYVYRVTEHKPSEATWDNEYTVNGMKYDPVEYYIHIEVKEQETADGTNAVYPVIVVNHDASSEQVDQTDGNGQLLEGNRLRFINTYTPVPATVDAQADAKIQVKKSKVSAVNGADVAWYNGEEYEFTLAAPDATDQSNEAQATRDGLANNTVVIASDNDKADSTVTVSDAPKGGAAFADAITFSKVGTYKFKITETVNNQNGVTCDTHVAYAIVTVTNDSATGKLKAAVSYDNSGATTDADRNEQNAAAFTNTYKTSDLNYNNGNGVPITKTLKGRDLKAEEFKFSISAVDGESKNKGAAEKKLSKSDKSFTNSAKADDGKSSTMTALKDLKFTQADAGKTFTYVVKEVEPEKDKLGGVIYDKSEYQIAIAVKDNGEGELTTETKITKVGDAQGAELSEIAFNNSYSAKPATDVTVPEGSALTKTLTGRDWKDGETFLFQVTGSDTNPDATVMFGNAMNGTVSVSKPKDGNTATIDLGKAEFKTAGTYTYTVKEIVPDEIHRLGGVTYSSNEAKVTVTVTDNKKGNLEASVSVDSPEFVNAYNSTIAYKDAASLSLTKTLHGHDMAENQFTFKVEALEDKDGKTTAAEAAKKWFNDEKTTVIEFKSGAEATMGQDDNAVGKVIDSAEPPMEFDQTDSGKTYVYRFSEVDGGKDSHPGYTYNSNGVKSYTLKITPTDNGNGTMTVKTVVVTDDGKTSDRTYEYKQGDQSAAKADINLAFENTYSATGTLDGSTYLKGTKTITGPWPLTPDLSGFEFKIEPKASNPAQVTFANNETTGQTVRSGEDGSFAFGDIKFTKVGVYRFTVTENNEPDAFKGFEKNTIDYSKRSYEVKVIVEEAEKNAGNGELQVYVDYIDNKVDGNVSSLDFTNEYNPKPETYDAAKNLKVSKVLKGRKWKDADSFTAKLEKVSYQALDAKDAETDGANVEAMPMPAAAEVAMTKDTQSTSFTGDMKFSKAGIYTYQVSENGGAIPGVTYDKTVYTVVITVKDNGKGELKAATEYKIGDKKAELSESGAMVFTNTYKAAAIESVDVTAGAGLTKFFTGREWTDKDVFEFQVTGSKGAPALSKVKDGKVSVSKPASGSSATIDLGAATFKEAGTYTYEVKEVASETGKKAGIHYDEHTATVTVNVTDNQDTGKLEATVNVVDNDKTFTNTYKAEPTGEVEVGAKAGLTKVLTGREWTKDDSFSFQVTGSSNNGVTAPELSGAKGGKLTVTKANVGKDGKAVIDLGKASFDTAGTYIYTVVELGTDVKPVSDANSSKDGVAYSKNVATVTVTVTDNQKGKLEAKVEAKDTKFENVYLTTPASYNAATNLKVAKNLIGRDWADGESFSAKIEKVSYQALDAKGAETTGTNVDAMPMPDATEVAMTKSSQSTNFTGSMSFSKTGVYTYKVTEVKPDPAEAGMLYSDTAYTVAITVTDNGKGQLEAKTTIDGAKDGVLTFTNAVLKKTVKVDEGTDAFVGKTLTYTISYANVTDSNATVTITDKVPAGTEFVKASDGGTLKDGAVTWALKGVEPGASGKVTLTVRVAASAASNTVANTATVKIGENGPKVDVTSDGVEIPANGSLTISKTVENAQDADKAKAFKFDVTLKDAAGTPLAGTYSGVTFDKNGMATIELKHDESKLIEGLPQGATYTVSEQKADGYTAKDDSLAGTIGADAATAAFTNTYATVVPDGETAKTNATFTKSFDKWGDQAFADKQFTFNLAAEDGAPLPTDAEGNPVTSVTVGKPAEGTKASFSFGAINYTADDLAGQLTRTFTYHVSEANGGQTIEGISYDRHTATLKVTVSDKNRDGKMIVTATVENGDFTNTYAAAATTVPAAEALGGTKKLKSVNSTKTLEADAFRFTATQTSGPKDVAAVLSSAKTVENNTNADAPNTGSFDFGALTFAQPGTYTFEVREEQDGKGGYTYDGTVYTVTFTVTDNNKGGLDVTRAITAGGKAVQAIAFTNTYEPATVSTETLGSISGAKSFVDIDGKAYDYTLKGGDFTFELVGGRNGAADHVDRATNKADGSIAFEPITFTQAGEYRYTVKEMAVSGVSGVKISGDSYDLVFKVEDKDGKLTITEHKVTRNVAGAKGKVARTEDAKLGDISFVNSYVPTETDVTFAGTKTIANYDPNATREPAAAGEFSFELTGDGIDKPQVVTNNAAGSFSFDTITYDRSGVYRYQIREIAGTDGNLAYDNTVYNVTVTVTDERGGLHAKVEGLDDNELASFTNTYAPTPVTVDPRNADLGVYLFKTLNGRDAKAGEFTFQLTDKDGKVVDTTTNAAAKDGEKKNFRFTKALTFDRVGEYRYTITEVGGGSKVAGVTYDSTAYTLIIDVTRDEENPDVLDAWLDLRRVGGPDEHTDVEFVNTYAADVPATVQLQAGKVLEGAELADGQFTFVLTGSNGFKRTATNDAEGHIDFGSVELAQAGTYTLKVVETNDEQKGVAYDTAEHELVVKVVDAGDGTLQASIEGEAPVFTNSYEKPKVPSTPLTPATPVEPAKPADDGKDDASKKRIPGTGDESMMSVAATLAASAMALAAGVVLHRKNRKGSKSDYGRK